MEEVENDPTYTDEQRQLYRDRLDDLNTEKQARLEILSQNRKDLWTQAARIRQTLEKFLIKIHHWQKEFVPYFLNKVLLTALSMIISTIVLAITGVFGGGGGGTGGSTPKDEGVLKIWLDRLANALKRLAGKAIEALPAIVAILCFLGKAIGFVAEHT